MKLALNHPDMSYPPDVLHRPMDYEHDYFDYNGDDSSWETLDTFTKFVRRARPGW